jgi:phosphate uptake regulator
MPGFDERLALLKQEIVAQGRRVLDLCTRAVDCFFDGDVQKAHAVVADDAPIDAADVAIERASVPLLAMGQTDEHAIRSVLTIVKVNNELERVADDGVTIAERVLEPARFSERVPAVFRVMANSVLGMLREVLTTYGPVNRFWLCVALRAGRCAPSSFSPSLSLSLSGVRSAQTSMLRSTIPTKRHLAKPKSRSMHGFLKKIKK